MSTRGSNGEWKPFQMDNTYQGVDAMHEPTQLHLVLQGQSEGEPKHWGLSLSPRRGKMAPSTKPGATPSTCTTSTANTPTSSNPKASTHIIHSTPTLQKCRCTRSSRLWTACHNSIGLSQGWRHVLSRDGGMVHLLTDFWPPEPQGV